MLTDYPDFDRNLASGAIRELNENGIVPFVENIDELLYSVRAPRSPIEKIDRLLLHIEKKTSDVGQGVSIKTDLYSVVYASSAMEMVYYIKTAREQMGYIERSGGDNYRLTYKGWERVVELKKSRPDSNQAFVAMSFDKDLMPVWEKGLKPALEEVGYSPIRVDTKQTNDKIDDKIIADIRKSGLVVADFTGQKNGVYFEAGFALGLGIPVIWTCKESDINDLHFDTRQYNHISWLDEADLKEQLLNRIEATLPNRLRTK